MILFYGAVTKTVYTALFSVTTVITILCLVYWQRRKELPTFPKKNVVPVFILFAIIILQILSTGFHMILLGVRGSSFFKDFSWGILLILIFVINYFVRGRKAEE